MYNAKTPRRSTLWKRKRWQTRQEHFCTVFLWERSILESYNCKKNQLFVQPLNMPLFNKIEIPRKASIKSLFGGNISNLVLKSSSFLKFNKIKNAANYSKTDVRPVRMCGFIVSSIVLRIRYYI